MSEMVSSGENTYGLDVESGAEMARLLDQDIMITKAMGGLFAERSDLDDVSSILDVACGPGGWVQEVAFAYPDIEVTGIDISYTMIEYARAQAQVQHLDNAKFMIMDAAKPLEFPDNSFDIVNARFMVGVLTQNKWPAVIKEFMRVARPGGIIRLTETDWPSTGITNSPALDRWTSLATQGAYRGGVGFIANPQGWHFGITPMLTRLLQEAGCLHIDKRAHVMDFSAGTEAFEENFKNLKTVLMLSKPFFLKAGILSEQEFQDFYQQVIIEMMSGDFRGIYYFLTAWGVKP
jgi:ubiquinone/menaquinone biosynthesis C-methylase UbiE